MDDFENAKKILSHPNFNKLSPEQIQVVFRSLLANGITKDQITAILESRDSRDITYLEALPYNVFTNLVLTQKIEGKDLIALCNSSPLINEKCNKAFTAKDGKIVPQYLFYTLLLKMGIDPEAALRDPRFFKFKDFRGLYKQIIANQPFKSLEQKLRLLDSVKDSLRTEYPQTIYDLLYRIDDYRQFGLVLMDAWGEGNNMLPVGNRDFQDATILMIVIEGLWNEYPNENIKFDLEDMVKSRGMRLEDYINNVVNRYKIDKSVTVDRLMNANDIFHAALNNLFKGKNVTREGIKERIVGRWESITDFTIEELEEENREQEIIDSVRAISVLSEEELNYLVYLHEKVLFGELPVLTLFLYDELLKY